MKACVVAPIVLLLLIAKVPSVHLQGLLDSIPADIRNCEIGPYKRGNVMHCYSYSSYVPSKLSPDTTDVVGAVNHCSRIQIRMPHYPVQATPLAVNSWQELGYINCALAGRHEPYYVEWVALPFQDQAHLKFYDGTSGAFFESLPKAMIDQVKAGKKFLYAIAGCGKKKYKAYLLNRQDRLKDIAKRNQFMHFLCRARVTVADNSGWAAYAVAETAAAAGDNQNIESGVVEQALPPPPVSASYRGTTPLLLLTVLLSGGCALWWT